ncbi:MAG: dihydrodipicolinate synthase family protein [Chlamydiales bacterium]|nr:dihydrodipicolinate synthase family protein [Chlamydiales bacterium]
MNYDLYAAALTPLKQDLSCDDVRLAEHCKALIARGCKGVVLFGTTGEGPSFSVSEKMKSVQEVVRYGVNPSSIILASGSSCLTDTVELVQFAHKLGFSATLVAPPSFYKNVSKEGIIAFYREVLERTEGKIILYHIPQYTGVPLTLEVVRTLYEQFPDRIAGLKESEGNFEFIKSVLQLLPSLKFYVGKEKQIPQAMKFGKVGSISGCANIFPEKILKLFEGEGLEDFEQATSILANKPFVATCKAYLKDFPKFVRPPLICE